MVMKMVGSIKREQPLTDWLKKKRIFVIVLVMLKKC